MSRTAVLSDRVWEQIEPLLPSSQGRRGRPFRDHRQVVEGIIYRYRTGCAWRDLPSERFGPWQTVWKRHHRFTTDGTWSAVDAESAHYGTRSESFTTATKPRSPSPSSPKPREQITTYPASTPESAPSLTPPSRASANP